MHQNIENSRKTSVVKHVPSVKGWNKRGTVTPLLHWEREYPAETSIKFPHGYYYMQAAIEVFEETLSTQGFL